MHRFTDEQGQYIKSIVLGRGHAEILSLFNERFGLQLGLNQIKAYIKNHKLNTGRTGQFPKGHEPFNKGRKGINQGGAETQFRRGQMPHNYKPVGTERISGEGYVEVKIADPKKWKGKHKIVWEAANGKIPKGKVLIFGDGNRLNVSLENLILVSRAELAVLNHKGYIYDHADYTRTGLIMAHLSMKQAERKKQKRRTT